MSGELTLAGMVKPVAGIREKILAACRARMAAVILPAANEADGRRDLRQRGAVRHQQSLREDDGRCPQGALPDVAA